MSGSTFGKSFSITTFGESHGKGLGVVVDGCPSGLLLSEELIQPYLDRRKPGQSGATTARAEADRVEILSGVFEGRTTGTPIAMLIRNTDQHSGDYSNIKELYRPGHADYCFDEKYGFRDYRGGGRSSGRETIGRVAGGAVAALLLKEVGIEFTTYVKSIGDIEISTFDSKEILNNPMYMPDKEAAKRAYDYVMSLREESDSVGGIVECRIKGVPAGLGEPVFDKLDALLAHAIFSIGAVKGFEIGSGFSAARKRGSENNDPFEIRDGAVAKTTNNSGGILGGISDGDEIVFRAAFKPTPSIARDQNTVNKDRQPAIINIKGRHDPVIPPRAVVVVECMAAIVIADLYKENLGNRLDSFRR
ncbi:MAG: chorismate synthase [Lachnospiraceae bacterium]|nr:chorismate synthase [Lachnospiraceae bacterium]